MKRFKVGRYKGQRLDGLTIVTRKLDGVRAERLHGPAVLSRKGKPLYNVPPGGRWRVAEVFCGSWGQTASAVRTHTGRHPVPRRHLYELAPRLDRRLIVGRFQSLDAERVKQLFDRVRRKGDEGLVLHHVASGRMLKVVSRFFHDVKVLGVKEGKPGSKYVGMLGALVTAKGDVGAGLTDKQRRAWWRNKKLVLGETIQVGCKGLTPSGKFREPSFERLRWDK